jgi:HEAT repeat protein
MADSDPSQENQDSSSSEAMPDGGAAPDVASSPYKNLLVPLILVPAMIVVVLLLVPLLMGTLYGEEASMDQNLQRVLQGGANERTQAAFALVEQLAENNRALLLEEEIPWEVTDELQQNLVSALEGLDDGDPQLQYVLSSALMNLGDPAGLEGLRGILSLGEGADPGAELRFQALLSLGIRGESESFQDVANFLGSDDVGLRQVAAGCLRFFPKELSLPSLKEALGDNDLSVRLNAAIGLSWLGDASGASLLRDGAGEELYQAERDREPGSYARQDIVRDTRVKAIEALIRLQRPEDRAFLEGISADEEDLEVREAALRVAKTSD